LNISETGLPGVLLIEARAFSDNRGYFFESYSKAKYQDAGITCDFVQDNVSYSHANVLRGLHFQYPTEQAKLVQVLSGEILDVAVDVRIGSPTFGKWIAEVLSAENHRQLFIPTGFAHGFSVLGDHAVLNYKCSALYDPKSEGTVLWNDPAIGIDWRISNPITSSKDDAGVLLADMPLDRMPKFQG